MIQNKCCRRGLDELRLHILRKKSKDDLVKQTHARLLCVDSGDNSVFINGTLTVE